MTFSQFTFYYIIAISIQVSLYIFMRRRETGTRYLYSLLILQITQNLILFSAFFVPHNNVNVEILLRFFYAASSLTAATLLSYAIEVCTVKTNDFIRQIENGVWIVAFCIAILSVFTDQILVGHLPLSFTATAIKGDIYWAFRTHIIFALLTACITLAREWLYTSDQTRKTHCLLIFTAYFSTTLFAVIITVLMQEGVPINVDTTLPFTTTFATCLIVYADFKYGWRAIEKNIPESLETSESDQFNDIFTKYSQGKYTFNEAMEKVDLLLLMHAYNKHNGNMMKTSKAMGLGRSTLYKKVQKHKLR